MCLVTQGSQGKYSNVTVIASLAPKTVPIDMTLYFLYNYKLGLNPQLVLFGVLWIRQAGKF
jgi:hypothetical protein